MSGGYNPMRHNCETQGCFNKVRRPKIEVFSDCFHGKIGMGDIDGIVEINQKILILEWKSYQGEISYGQRRTYEVLTGKVTDWITVIIVAGDAETMSIEAIRFCMNGKLMDWEISDLNSLKDEVKRWASWARYPGKFEQAA